IVDRARSLDVNEITTRVSDKQVGMIVGANIQERSAGIARLSDITIEKDKLLPGHSGFHPGVNGEIACPQVEITVCSVNEYSAASIETQCLAYFARSISFSTLPRVIVVVLQIKGRTVTRPPILQVRGR